MFIKFMTKESVSYISMLEYVSDACSETNINLTVETIHSELSRYSIISAIHLLTKFLSLLETPQSFSVFLCSVLLCNSI